MEVGHLIHFSSQKYPFVVETEPCLDLDCSCSMMGLTLREVDLSSPPRDRLKFTLRVCLKTWTEDFPPPPRSLEVETLAREFMVRFPVERRQELSEEFQRRRARQRRLQSVVLTGSRDKLVAYSEIVEEEELRQGIDRHAFFFVFEGREFFVEDHYCPNPSCDCQEVNLEFWERVYKLYPERCIKIEPRLNVSLNFQGQRKKTRLNEESAATTKRLLQAWRRRCGDQLSELRQRYELIKTIGARSFSMAEKAPPAEKALPAKKTLRVEAASASPFKRRKTEPLPVPVTAQRSTRRIRRNDPCPCGSGLKFKRCCARRSTATK